MTVSVIGVVGSRLAPGGRERLASASLVLGGRRQLEAHAQDASRRVALDGDIDGALDRIGEASGDVAVLASGDPGFFGIVRALSARFGRDRIDVLPAASSVATAFARAGLSWDDALVVSAHGRSPRAALNVALAHPKVAVLTEPRFTPADLAAGLRGGPPRRLLVAERLGEPGERLTEGTPEELAGRSFEDPNVVLVLDPDARSAGKGAAWPSRQVPTEWALGEDAFAHRDGMITKAEVRALALARLAPGPGDLVWDVGAGSGSVAVECARFGAAVIAVERDTAACDRARANADAHGVSVRVVTGEAPEALRPLADPDAVFVGGGGTRLPAILDVAAARARRSVVAALATVERVAPAARRLENAGLRVEATMLQASRLRSLGGGHGLTAANPVFIVSGSRS